MFPFQFHRSYSVFIGTSLVAFLSWVMQPIMAFTVSTFIIYFSCKEPIRMTDIMRHTYCLAVMMQCVYLHDLILHNFSCIRNHQKPKVCDVCRCLPLSDRVWGLFLVQVHHRQYHHRYHQQHQRPVVEAYSHRRVPTTSCLSCGSWAESRDVLRHWW